MFLKIFAGFYLHSLQRDAGRFLYDIIVQKGVNRMAQKVGEEAVETVIEATNGTDDRLIYEASDLIYQWIVLLTSKGYAKKIWRVSLKVATKNN